jgi:multidrug efflux pump subunit AcrB
MYINPVIGILGLLSWFGVDLDPITMSAMLISIGFSIDVPAHVAYHFHASGRFSFILLGI